MKIDRSNYEIWLIDWLDGNLSGTEIEELQLFLKANPDLNDEVEELNTVRLSSLTDSYSLKNQLKKTPADLTRAHIEYLSAAYLEGDLSSYQKSELEEIVDSDPDKKKTFELTQRMKLAPLSITFRYKSRLTRRSFAGKIIRLSVIGLPAAAMIALAILSYYSGPRTTSFKQEIISKTGTEDSISVKPADSRVQNKFQTEEKSNRASRKQRNLSLEASKTVLISSVPGIVYPTEKDTSLIPKNSLPAVPEKIYFPGSIRTNTLDIPNTLVAFKSTQIIPEIDDGRSKLGKFLARNFREKILKENRAQDSPLKAYEIAEAGVSGLNKLLGWEMALDKRNDDNGELKSVYFSSKMLKFNAPVKKNESLR
jgi:hypothetical protein